METNFNLQIAKVVGTPFDGFWSQVHTFSPEEPEKKEKRGELLAVLVITGVPQGVEAVAAGREVLGRLHEEYYGNLDGSAFERLKAAVEKVSLENENLEIAAASLVGQALSLAICGEGKVFLKRGDKLGVILNGEGPLTTGSGLLLENDFLVIGSRHFFEVVGSGVLKASLEAGSPEDAVETLAPIVLGRSEMVAAAAVLVLAKKSEEEEIQPIEPPVINKVVPKKTNLPFLPKRPIFIRSETKEKRKKLYFLMAIVLLLGLGVSLVMGIRNKTITQKKNKASELTKLAEDKLNQGKILASSDVNQGKVLGLEAEKLSEQALSLNKTNEEAAFLKEETKKFIVSLGEEAAVTPSLFMDLNLITDGDSGIAFSLADKNLAILDQIKNKIYLLNWEKKSSEVIDNTGEKGNLITSYDSRVFILDDKGIFEKEDKKTSLKVAKDSSWEEITGLGTFFGNLYLLDKGASNIWRYLGANGEFGAKKSWFVGTPPDLSGGVSLAIDGSIWVLTKDKILKLTLGQEDNFALSKMPESFSEPIKIYTSADAQNLYILDKGNGKVYQITKTGEFKTSYSWSGFKGASDIVAIESAKKLFILSGAKIFEMELK